MGTYKGPETMQVLNFFCLNLFKATKCSSYQIWGPKRFRDTVSLRINAQAFIKFFKFLEDIYSRDVFNRRGHLFEVHTFFIRRKFIRIPRLRIGLVLYHISWSTKFELETILSFKRADRIKMNFKHYFRGRGSTSFAKIELWNKNISGSVKNYWFLYKRCVIR